MGDAAQLEPTAGLEQVREALARMYDAGERDVLIEAVVSLLAKVNADNEHKEIRIRQLLKQLYGRKSEKLSPNQLRLAIEALAVGSEEPAADAASADDAESPDSEITPAAQERAEPRRKHPGRNPLPGSLPRVERRHTVSDADKVCEGCGKAKRQIREERTQGLNWIPGHFEVIEDVQEVWACSCGDGKVVTATAPKRHVCGGLARCGLLAQVLIQKFRDHLPLHRQAKIFARAGVTLSPNTMGDWVKAVADALGPLHALIMARVMKAHVVQTDDTGLLVLGDPAGGKGKRKRKNRVTKGHIWTFVGDGLYVAYAYTPTWEKEGPGALLAEREGWLQADGYGGFDHIFARGDPKVYEVGCMMHARRYWIKAFDAGDLRAAEPLELIRKLYKVEADAKKAGDDHDARLVRRTRESAPLMKSLQACILERKPNEPPKTPMAKALTYASNQWQALNRFLEDGALEIDNGGAERSLRGTALGRRNWLFAGSDDGARRVVVINSVIESAVLHDLEPWLYLSDVLQKLDDGWPQARLDELLPHRWAQLHGPAANHADGADAHGQLV